MKRLLAAVMILGVGLSIAAPRGARATQGEDADPAMNTGSSTDTQIKSKSPLKPKPKLHAPSFPLEPGHRPAEPVRPETFVEGADSPPGPPDPAFARPYAQADAWWRSFELGWFIANQTSAHHFSTGQSADQANSNALSLAADFSIEPPRWPVSLELGGAATSGRPEVKLPGSGVAETGFDVQDYRFYAGPRFHFLPRESKSDLSFALQGAADFASVLTLTPDYSQLDVDNRRLFMLVPRIDYRVSPGPNWSLSLGLGYESLLSSGGQGDVHADSFRGVTTGLQAIRYLASGNGIGFGVNYFNERINWIQTSPRSLSDRMINQDLRLSIYWRRDY